MFKRIIYDDWTSMLPVLAFLLTAGAFVYLVVMAVRMNEKKRKHLSELPLQDDTLVKENNDE